MFMIVILGQMLAIASLSTWIYEEYVNNLYLRQYVGNFLQTEGWIIAVLVVTVALGSLTSLFLKRPVKRMEPVETVSTKARVAVELPRVVAEAREKTEAGFHPAVAALMADIAGRRASIATPPVPRREEARTVLTVKDWEEGTPAVRPTSNLYPVATGPRQDQSRSSVPQPALPIAETNEAVRSNVTRPIAPASPSIPRNVTTVITGIIPASKKKGPTHPRKRVLPHN